ncbi:MAG TPA: hypothetical protein VLX28_20115, partial [Thermoanaerobaculia bacterium]|nr:hypothetical protein [Thermoanaerobaculia bacterium]
MNPTLLFLTFLLIFPLVASVLAAEAPQGTVELPVAFEENRFFVVPATASGQTLRLYTDSGGGLFLLAGAAKRLGLSTKTMGEGQEKMDVAELPAFRPGASIPPPVGNGGLLPIFPDEQAKRGGVDSVDGMLGQAWFAGRVWTWDYPGRRLLWRTDGSVPTVAEEHRVSLGFKAGKDGERLAFPRIAATVDGETLDLLFDTGAMVSLSPEALAKLDDHGPALRGTSFIAAVHFDRWRQKHPDWRVVEKADLNMKGEPMIEVPAVTVAGYTVGPAWFTRRPDPSFHQFMSQYMDRQVEGALGGSALRFFRVTVDYPHAVAVFER